MKDRLVIDTVAFCRNNRQLSGEIAVASLARLADLVLGAASKVQYVISGAFADGNPQVAVSLEGELTLTCQRCLGSLSYKVDVSRVFEFVKSEIDLDDESLEGDVDLLLLEKEVDLGVLIEDELILALPLVPRHVSCALPSSSEQSEIESPFAALRALQSKIQ